MNIKSSCLREIESIVKVSDRNRKKDRERKKGTFDIRKSAMLKYQGIDRTSIKDKQLGRWTYLNVIKLGKGVCCIPV